MIITLFLVFIGGFFAGMLYTLTVIDTQGPGAVSPKKEWINSIKHDNIYFKQNIKKYLEADIRRYG